MALYIPIAGEITPSWLSAVLYQSGILGHGVVTTVENEMLGTFNSHTSHLFLKYSDNASPGVPTRLLLKRNIQGEWGVEAGEEEVKFYSLMASLPAYPPAIVPCYAAAYDETSGNSYLLLQDLAETHIPPVTRDQQISLVESVPPAAYIVAVVNALAQLHAYWWEHPLLNADEFFVGYWLCNAERFEQYLERRTTAWKSLIANEAAWFPNDLRELYEQLLAHLPHYWQRYLEPRFRKRSNLTLLHGDAYFSNFLCPKDPAAGATYLVDWQSYSFDIGGNDLVNLCATFWTSEQRQEEQREEKLLRHYYTVLQANGVKHYSWDNLLLDYKMGLIYWMLMPVQDRYNGSSRDYWWPKMQCLAAAFRQWHCENLLNM